MVRRRSASPAPSRPLRSSPPPPSSSSSRAPVPSSPMPAQSGYQGPGLMGQMAATAGGVAIGSAVGHAVGNMFTGGSSDESHPVHAEASNNGYSQYQQPCEVEWRQFVECTQNQSDVTMCQSFNELFKGCKQRLNGGTTYQ